MHQETFIFLKHLIRDGNVSRTFDKTKTVYNITSDFGTSAQIIETIVPEPNNTTARHYQIKIDNETIIQVLCDNKITGHDQMILQIKNLLHRCSDKLFYQEIQMHKQERINHHTKQGK